MEKLEKTLMTFGLAGAIAFGNSCAYLGKQHTKQENFAWGIAAAATHTVDAGITIYALNNGFNVHERNPLHKNPSTERIIVTKVAYLGFNYILGKIYPEHKGGLYKIATFFGASATAWNLGMLLFHPPKK